MTVWYSAPGRFKGHLAAPQRQGTKSPIATYCGLTLDRMAQFEPAHDGQCCWHCVPTAERLGHRVDTPGPWSENDAARPPGESPIDLDAVLLGEGAGDDAR